jgi:hypothetical protein
VTATELGALTMPGQPDPASVADHEALRALLQAAKRAEMTAVGPGLALHVPELNAVYLNTDPIGSKVCSNRGRG